MHVVSKRVHVLQRHLALDVTAGPAKDRVRINVGKGYNHTEEDKELPPQHADATFGDAEQQEYRQFKEAREQNVMNYHELEGSLLDDPYTIQEPREPVNDEVEVLIIGGGFGALLSKARLEKVGFTSVRICEKGGDVGGTWYWNRYPGIACDVESYSYLPMLDDTGYVPSMKFASGFEIFEYCKKLAEKFGVYKPGAALFHTTVIETKWDETIKRWRVITDRGENIPSLASKTS